MRGEHAVLHTAKIPAAPISSVPEPTKGHDLNVMLLLATLEKATMDADARIGKYYGQQQFDGVFEENLMAAIEQGVESAGGYTPYKGAEAIIDRYMATHNTKNMDANRILTVYDLKNMNAQLKSKDALIAGLVRTVAHDESEYISAYHTVQNDENEIDHWDHELGSWKDWFFGWYKRECEEQIAYYRLKLKITDGPNLEKWAERLKADEGALTAQVESEKVLFFKRSIRSKRSSSRYEIGWSRRRTCDE